MKTMNRLLGLMLFPLLGMISAAQSPSAREIMQKYKSQDRTKDVSITLTMTLINARGGTREREVTQVTKTDESNNRKQLIRFLSPADIEGTGFLSIEHSDRDDDNWLYLPALRKTRRIAGSDKTDRFVGSEFTYEDLDTEDLDVYSYSVSGSDKIHGTEAWLVTAIPTDPEKLEETGYSKRELWISQDHYLVLQTKYYDREGRYVKLFKASDVRQVSSTQKWRAYKMTMEDVHSRDKTVIALSDYKIDQGVKGELFSERYLKRGR